MKEGEGPFLEHARKTLSYGAVAAQPRMHRRGGEREQQRRHDQCIGKREQDQYRVDSPHHGHVPTKTTVSYVTIVAVCRSRRALA